MNQLINVAVAEKVSALRTEEYFAERAARGYFEEGASGAQACREKVTFRFLVTNCLRKHIRR